MPNILTVTLNPALDLSSSLERVIPGPKLRCTTPTVDPGGGGLNVSRAISHLGGKSLALIALGGTVGLRLRTLLEVEGIDLLAFEIDGETRQSLAITSTIQTEQYRFVFPGPEWAPEQVTKAMHSIENAVQQVAILVISGSLPPGVPPGFTATLAARLPSKKRIVVDNSGAPLDWLVENPSAIEVLRMDATEADTLSGKVLTTRQDAADFARNLTNRGVAKVVIIARGADGSVMAAPEGLYHSCCDVTEIRSKVGAGDSFVGAFALAMDRGETWPEALRLGVAAAGAAVMTDGTELCQRADTENLLQKTEINRL